MDAVVRGDPSFDAEYVNIFGVPFTFLPHEGGDGPPPPPPPPKTAIEPVSDKAEYALRWPNIIRIDHVYRPCLTLDLGKVKPLELNASQTAKLGELAPILEGKPDVTKIAEIDLERLAREFRMQKIVFETARDVLRPDAKGLEGQQGVSVRPARPPGRAELDRNPAVAAWVKNDHLGFEVLYIYKGVVRKYHPDFLIRLASGTTLVLETKGQDTEQDRTKRRFSDEWVKAVNAHGGFGSWRYDVVLHPKEVLGILRKHAQSELARQEAG